MKFAEIVESGTIGADGKLRLPMDRLRQFFSEHKGERLIVRFEAVKSGTNEAQLAYYFRYILPTIRQAFYETGERMTEDAVDEFLRRESAVCWKDGECRSIRQLRQEEMSDFIDWLKQYAAENLYVYIEDPKTL